VAGTPNPAFPRGHWKFPLLPSPQPWFGGSGPASIGQFSRSTPSKCFRRGGPQGGTVVGRSGDNIWLECCAPRDHTERPLKVPNLPRGGPSGPVGGRSRFGEEGGTPPVGTLGAPSGAKPGHPPRWPGGVKGRISSARPTGHVISGRPQGRPETTGNPGKHAGPLKKTRGGGTNNSGRIVSTTRPQFQDPRSGTHHLRAVRQGGGDVEGFSPRSWPGGPRGPMETRAGWAPRRSPRRFGGSPAEGHWTDFCLQPIRYFLLHPPRWSYWSAPPRSD